MAKVATTTPKLDKTIFNGKILFPAGSGNNFGYFYVGGASDANSTNSAWTGFYLRGSTTVDEGLDLLYTNDSGTAYNICTFKKETAGTTLRGNENLQVSVSVETIKDTESGSTVTVKLGVFFDGKLYDNQYYYWSINRDEEGIANRWQQSEQLLAFWQQEVGNGLLFATGDYNDNQRTQSIDNLQSSIYKEVIWLKGGSDYVINQIDHVFCNPQVMKLKESGFLRATVGGTVLSDHTQILTTISYQK